jgi:hypothetical protein
MVDDITHASMVALLARWQLAWNTKKEQTAIRDEAAKIVNDNAKIVDECKALALSLGFNRDEPGWDNLISSFIPDAQRLYERSKPPGMPEWKWVQPKTTADVDLEAGVETEQKIVNRPSVREIALERLELASEEGLKAADLREFIETTYAGEIHEKTVGMTLYRLLKDGLVRREGHKWFFVPQNAERKNPGAGTPGLVETGN